MALPILSPLRKRPIGIYTDFHKDLTVNPLSNDIALLLDEEAVKESLKNLLLTDRGERLFQPEVGSDIRASLFENNTPSALVILKQQVIDTINNFETRVTLIDVAVQSEYDQNRVVIVIQFFIKNKETPVTLSLFLQRTR